MSAIWEFFEAIYDWWQEEQAKAERRKLSRLKARDGEASVLFDLEIKAIDAETARVEAEIRLIKAGG